MKAGFAPSATGHLLDLDHLGVGLSQAQLIATDGDLHGIAQRGYLADEYLGAAGDAHVHDAALDRALAVELYHLDGLADLDLTQCFHTFLSFFVKS